MKKTRVRCKKCGKNLFFLLPECTRGGVARIEIKCSKDRCGAINIVDYSDPQNLTVSLAEDSKEKEKRIRFIREARDRRNEKKYNHNIKFSVSGNEFTK